MVTRFTLDKFCCLSLSTACLFFGLLDLIANISIVTLSSINLHIVYNNSDLYFIIAGVIGISTCSLMMIGSIRTIRCLLLPHLVWELFLIGSSIMVALISTGTYLANGALIEALVTVVTWSLILLISALFWNIMYSRFVQMKKKQSIPTELVEME